MADVCQTTAITMGRRGLLIRFEVAAKLAGYEGELSPSLKERLREKLKWTEGMEPSPDGCLLAEALMLGELVKRRFARKEE